MKNMISSISQGVGKAKSKIWGVKIFWGPIGEKTSLVPKNDFSPFSCDMFSSQKHGLQQNQFDHTMNTQTHHPTKFIILE
jgi:hypothetical protein